MCGGVCVWRCVCGGVCVEMSKLFWIFSSSSNNRSKQTSVVTESFLSQFVTQTETEHREYKWFIVRVTLQCPHMLMRVNTPPPPNPLLFHLRAGV